MRKKIIRVAASAVAITMGLGLVACSPGDSIESGELRVYSPYPESEVPLNAVARAYEETHPGVSILVETTPYDGYEEALQTQFIGKTAPDVLVLEPPAITSFSQRGFLLDLTDDFKEGWAESFLPTTLGSLRGRDGKDYAAPWTIINLKQGYRADILDDLGLEPPTTWTEDIEVSQAAQEAGILPRWYGLAGNDAGLWWRLTLTLNAGFRTITDEVNIKGDPKQYDPTNPESISGEAYEADELYVAFKNGLIDPAKSPLYRDAIERRLREGTLGVRERAPPAMMFLSAVDVLIDERLVHSVGIDFEVAFQRREIRRATLIQVVIEVDLIGPVLLELGDELVHVLFVERRRHAEAVH